MTERTEDRLRAALRAEADDVSVDPDAWSKVQRRAGAHRSSAARTVVLVAAGVLLLVLGAGAMLLQDDDTTVDVRPADDGTTTSSVVDSTTTTVTVEEPAFDGIWPFTSQEQVDAYVADPGIGMFFDADVTALEFARAYLGMPEPVVRRGFQVAEGDSGSVQLSSRDRSPMVTTVWVHRYGGEDGAYAVYLAETPNIQVDREALDDPVRAPSVAVSGTSTAYEAHVDVEVRDAEGRVLGRTYVMGGANGELGAFAGEVSFDEPTTPTGAIVLSTSSAEDGSLQEATVVPIRFELATAETAFSVFFHRDEQLVEVRRIGPRTAGVLRQALEALVAGPRPEDGDGLDSLFSEETADVLAGVSITDGTAVLDLAYEVNNASTSAGSAAFLAELDATVFQFPTVERIEYRLGGSCDAFWEWLQYGDCRIIERS
ncbi:MAG TPA: Gmad2 immunoglobulin-like domain-containing protein [Acidimicrobiales bacterium]|nr:Gmad2 immunoglobulin-like domain-containing protein [Acidimicrobiales bacterium]